MYPEGYGETASGGERETDVGKIRRKMGDAGIDPSEFEIYFETLRAGTPPSSGCGIGFERLVRYICGLDKVWEAAPFPKIPGVLSP